MLVSVFLNGKAFALKTDILLDMMSSGVPRKCVRSLRKHSLEVQPKWEAVGNRNISVSFHFSRNDCWHQIQVVDPAKKQALMTAEKDLSGLFSPVVNPTDRPYLKEEILEN